MAEILLKKRPQQVRRGLPKRLRDALDAKLLRLVGNPVPRDAIPINANPRRYRIQVGALTIGYELNPKDDEVIIKAILHDEESGQMDEAEISKWLEAAMRRG